MLSWHIASNVRKTWSATVDYGSPNRYSNALYSVPFMQICRRLVVFTKHYDDEFCLFHHYHNLKKHTPLCSSFLSSIYNAYELIFQYIQDALPETDGKPQKCSDTFHKWHRTDEKHRFWLRGLGSTFLRNNIRILLLYEKEW